MLNERLHVCTLYGTLVFKFLCGHHVFHVAMFHSAVLNFIGSVSADVLSYGDIAYTLSTTPKLVQYASRVVCFVVARHSSGANSILSFCLYVQYFLRVVLDFDGLSRAREFCCTCNVLSIVSSQSVCAFCGIALFCSCCLSLL